MKVFLLWWSCVFLFIFSPFVLWGKLDYSLLEVDSPEVQQAAEEAVKKLGPEKGSIGIEKNVVDIIGIPKGMAEGGVAVTGRVVEVEKALKDLGAKVTETEIKIELPSDILFDFDKYDIRSDAQEALDKVAVVIRTYPGKSVFIEGHTDSVGSDEYNARLSLQRAESVKQWLQQKESLKDSKFVTKGWGESKPTATNETEQGRQKNRRVEITIKK